jgi:hypothetical protein
MLGQYPNEGFASSFPIGGGDLDAALDAVEGAR